jgi:hypothetical protein
VPVPVLRSLAGATFRTSPQCELVPLTGLEPREARYLAGRSSETGAAGIVRAGHAAGAVLKIVDAPSAQLLARLREPGPLPARRKPAAPPDEAEAQAARLVLDGALQIETAAGFVGGPPAFDALVERYDADERDDTAVARLSRAAVAYAAALRPGDANVLSARLYCYGRAPASPRRRREVPRRDGVADVLQFRTGLPGAGGVRAAWQAKFADRPADGWFSWHRARRNGAAQPLAQTYKLYVSPAPAAVRDAFPALVAALTGTDAVSFKVGADLYGLLRPDKIVAYFASLRALEAAADAIARALAGVPAHGVPFTCPIDDAGLLSWGCDPPSASSAPDRESWRLWITNRLADALLHAQANPPRTMPVEAYAFARIALDGVDPASWTPRAVAWRDASAG